MRLYSQMGYGDGTKTKEGLDEGQIDGAILSPRDCRPDGINSKISELLEAKPDADILFDPQFYATFTASLEAARLGNLPDWPYFSDERTSNLEQSEHIIRVLRDTFQHIVHLPVSSVIAPNIYISRSFDSREAVIAKNFIRNAREIYNEFGVDRPLYATIAVCREALLDSIEFEEFLNDITMILDPPDGYYILIGSHGSNVHTDIYHTDVIARWMLLNYSLNVNGFDVINGYSDILTPFLGSVGAGAGATGWFSNLRSFSLSRFEPAPSGGRRPIKRYLSKNLLNRITFPELQALVEIIPEVLNRLPHDDDYDPEPEINDEILQTWEAIRYLNEQMSHGDINQGLASAEQAVIEADGYYSLIAEAGIALRRKSGNRHIEPLQEGIEEFKQLAGII